MGTGVRKEPWALRREKPVGRETFLTFLTLMCERECAVCAQILPVIRGDRMKDWIDEGCIPPYIPYVMAMLRRVALLLFTHDRMAGRRVIHRYSRVWERRSVSIGDLLGFEQELTGITGIHSPLYTLCTARCTP